jgi:hypothetical protein
MYSAEELQAEYERRTKSKSLQSEYNRRFNNDIPSEESANRSWNAYEQNLPPEQNLSEKIAYSWPVQSILAEGDYLSNSMSNAGRSVINPISSLLGGPKLEAQPIKTGQGEAYDFASDIAPYATAAAIASVMSPISAGATILGGSGVGALLNPEDPLGGALLGGGTAGVGEGAGRLIGKGVEKYLPKAIQASQQFLRGNLPEADILARQDIAKGTSTSLGQILEQPYLTQLHENILKYIPGSGYQAGARNTKGEITRRAEENLMKAAGGEFPSEGVDVRKEIARGFQEGHFEDVAHQQILREEIDEMGNMLGVEVGRDNVASASSKILQAIDASPNLKKYLDPSFIKQMEDFSRQNKPQSFGQHFSGEQSRLTSSINETNIERAMIRDMADEAFAAGNKTSGRRYKSVSQAFRDDIRQAIEKSGNKDLVLRLNEADRHFAESIGPWDKSSEARKHLNDTYLQEYQTIVKDFLKPGSKMDAVQDLELLNKKLSPKQKDYLRFWHLSDETGESSVKGMNKAWEGLGPKQKAELVPDEALRKALDDQVILAKMNPKVMNEMYNPETGSWAKMGAGIASALTTGGAIIPLARGATKLLTDEKLIDKQIKLILDKELGKNASKAIINASKKPYSKAKITAQGVTGDKSRNGE